MLEKYYPLIIKLIVGVSGGVAAVWVTANKEEKMTMRKAIGIMFLGLCGAVWIAPVFNEYFGFAGGTASGVSFIVAVCTQFILLLLFGIFQSLVDNVDLISKKIIEKYFKK